MNDQVIEKLKKILALATGKGATEAEMRTAMAKAKQLAMEHNIDLSTVNVEGEVKMGAMETDFADTKTATKQEQPYHLPVIEVVKQCFDVKCILQTYTDHNSMRHITNITWVGEKTDLALAVYMWGWLEALFPKCWGEYRKVHGIVDNYVSKRSYFFGLRDGIIEANRRIVAELPVAVKDRYALVLVNKQAVVEGRFNQMFPNTGKMRSFSTQHDGGARAAGHAKGRTIKLNPGLTGGSTGSLK